MSESRKLPSGVSRSIGHWFGSEDSERARKALTKLAADLARTYKGCGLPENQDQVRRILVAVSRGSQGDLEKLRSLARLALVDWRDVL